MGDMKESWGVYYYCVHEYESETEARRQLALAAWDVPAYLVMKIGDGEWVPVQ